MQSHCSVSQILRPTTERCMKEMPYTQLFWKSSSLLEWDTCKNWFPDVCNSNCTDEDWKATKRDSVNRPIDWTCFLVLMYSGTADNLHRHFLYLVSVSDILSWFVACALYLHSWNLFLLTEGKPAAPWLGSWASSSSQLNWYNQLIVSAFWSVALTGAKPRLDLQQKKCIGDGSFICQCMTHPLCCLLQSFPNLQLIETRCVLHKKPQVVESLASRAGATGCWECLQCAQISEPCRVSHAMWKCIDLWWRKISICTRSATHEIMCTIGVLFDQICNF